MFTSLIKLSKQLPESLQERIYQALRPTGIPYVISYVAKYKGTHCLDNFAGNLPSVKEEYLQSTGRRRQLLSERFDAIIDNLVMKNGVKKTTYAMRQNRILTNVLNEEKSRLDKNAIRVLDIPSSIGTASLDIYEMLSHQYTISSYLLGDLYFKIYYDQDRGCIYDDEGNLLQVRLGKQFFSINRPNTTGNVYNYAAYWLLLPLDLVSWRFRKKYPYLHHNNYLAIALLHPDVESRLHDSVFRIRKTDVFQSIDEKFDVIISFNLLQKNYFPQELIRIGIENLKTALNEGGLLIMGNTESFSVSRKINGDLLAIEKIGDF